MCRKHYDADRYARNPEPRRKYALNYRKNNPEKYFQIRTPEYCKEIQLKLAYGMTLAEYRARVEAQGGACAICEILTERLCVDHDHNSGRVRKLLCHKCNRGLGHFNDSPDLLQRAAAYLAAGD